MSVTIVVRLGPHVRPKIMPTGHGPKGRGELYPACSTSCPSYVVTPHHRGDGSLIGQCGISGLDCPTEFFCVPALGAAGLTWKTHGEP